MDEIREQIDSIDREIIHLFSMRSAYVHEIVRYKTDEESVIAKERKEQVIRQRGEWAEASGLDKLTFETIYKTLVEQNISEELSILHLNK